jgi:DnaD/phage-associated family protein
LACSDEKCALLYLHILRCGSFSASQAARDLRCTREDIALAAETLRRLGIMPGGEILAPAEELPQYTGQDVSNLAKSDTAFQGLVFEIQQSLGKMLSTNDLNILLVMYDHYGLPAEVIYLLVNHCIETYRAAYGEGRMPTMKYIEKEARFWVQNEIITLDAAEEHIRRERERQQQSEQVKEVLQIRGRALSPSERRFVEEWLSLGFSPAAIAIAYDRTLVGTGKLAWKYMDKILHDWSSRGLLTPEDIEKGDARREKKSPAPAQDQAGSVSREIENMRKLYESMQKGR